MSVETIAIFVTLAIENAFPSLLAPKVKDAAIREREVIPFSEE